MSRAAALFITLITLLSIGCANKLIKTPLPENMVGKLKIEKVIVKNATSLESLNPAEKVKASLEEKLREKSQGTHKVTMSLVIEEWTAAKQGAASKLLGSKSTAKGTVKILDESGGVIAEYGVMADESSSGLLSGTVNFTDVEKIMVDKFTRFSLQPIF